MIPHILRYENMIDGTRHDFPPNWILDGLIEGGRILLALLVLLHDVAVVGDVV
jgi:hypothetical protein